MGTSVAIPSRTIVVLEDGQTYAGWSDVDNSRIVELPFEPDDSTEVEEWLREHPDEGEPVRTRSLLSMGDAINLHVVIQAAQSNATVVRLIDDDLIRGTARHIVKSPDNIGFLRNDEDVRDGYLRVTSDSGWEFFWPVRELMRDVGIGYFVIEA